MTMRRASVRASGSAGVPREELFITSKLRNGGHARDAALKSFDETMKALGLDWLDMFLIHWPVPGQDKYVEAWKTLIELQQQGRIRSIGVSNFNEDHLERIIGETGVVPVVNQIELHPCFTQADKRGYLKSKGIHIECYSPLGSGAVLKDETIKTIGGQWQVDRPDDHPLAPAAGRHRHPQDDACRAHEGEYRCVRLRA